MHAAISHFFSQIVNWVELKHVCIITVSDNTEILPPQLLSPYFQVFSFEDKDTGWCSIYQVNIWTIVSFYCVNFIVLLCKG